MTVYTVSDVDAFMGMFDDFDYPRPSEVRRARKKLESGQIKSTTSTEQIEFEMSDEGAIPLNKGIIFLYP